MSKATGIEKGQEKVLVVRIDMAEALSNLEREIRRRIRQLERGGR